MAEVETNNYCVCFMVCLHGHKEACSIPRSLVKTKLLMHCGTVLMSSMIISCYTLTRTRFVTLCRSKTALRLLVKPLQDNNV